jgi:hypothetical protein
MHFEIPKTDKELTWEMEAHFTQAVQAKVEPRLSNSIGAATEISLKGFTIGVKANLKTYYYMVPRAKKDTYQLGGANSQTYETLQHTHTPPPPPPPLSQHFFFSLSPFLSDFYLASRLSICCLLG